METKYALVWRRDGSEGFYWFIRGIKADASFYGEVGFNFQDTTKPKRKIIFVEETISPDDWPQCRKILETLAGQPISQSKQCFAALWKWSGGSLSNSVLIFQYNLGDEKDSAAARQFLELKDILEKQISKRYKDIT